MKPQLDRQTRGNRKRPLPPRCSWFCSAESACTC